MNANSRTYSDECDSFLMIANFAFDECELVSMNAGFVAVYHGSENMDDAGSNMDDAGSNMDAADV